MLASMTPAQANPQAPSQPPLTNRARLLAAAPMAAVVPFVIAALLTLGLSTLVVLLLCVLVGAALLAVPKRGRWLALGWAVGCVLWAAALTVLFMQVGQDLARIG
jgi:uncharacterized membrane protein YdbT with pleckstrin-like domain